MYKMKQRPKQATSSAIGVNVTTTQLTDIENPVTETETVALSKVEKKAATEAMRVRLIALGCRLTTYTPCSAIRKSASSDTPLRRRIAHRGASGNQTTQKLARLPIQARPLAMVIAFESVARWNAAEKLLAGKGGDTMKGINSLSIALGEGASTREHEMEDYKSFLRDVLGKELARLFDHSNNFAPSCNPSSSSSTQSDSPPSDIIPLSLPSWDADTRPCANISSFIETLFHSHDISHGPATTPHAHVLAAARDTKALIDFLDGLRMSLEVSEASLLNVESALQRRDAEIGGLKAHLARLSKEAEDREAPSELAEGEEGEAWSDTEVTVSDEGTKPKTLKEANSMLETKRREAVESSLKAERLIEEGRKREADLARQNSARVLELAVDEAVLKENQKAVKEDRDKVEREKGNLEMEKIEMARQNKLLAAGRKKVREREVNAAKQEETNRAGREKLEDRERAVTERERRAGESAREAEKAAREKATADAEFAAAIAAAIAKHAAVGRAGV